MSGSTIVVGAAVETLGGRAYVFKAQTGALVHTLTSPNAQTNGYFGWVDDASGNAVVVGAWFETADSYAGAGHAYIYFMAPPFSS